MTEPTIHRYEIPVDDQWHILELTGETLHVAARRPDVVELWAMANYEPPVAWEFRVFGTGQLLPAGPLFYAGTALVAYGTLVWHLMMRPATNTLEQP
jgi:hypothetical protein